MYMDLFDCRHGRVVFFDHRLREVMLFDPATGGRRHVVVPPVFDEKDIGVFNAAVICVAGDEGHVHGDCHTSPFQVVLIGIHDDNKRKGTNYPAEASVFVPSATAAIRYMCELSRPSTLVGDSVYWVFDGNEDGILKFDLDSHSLVNIELPDLLRYYSCSSSFKIMSTDDGSFGLAVLEYQKFEMWERKVGCDGVAGWVLQKTFQLNTILGLGPMGETDNLMLGYDEDDRVIYVRTDIGVCIIQLETMQFRNLGKDNFTTTAYYPYKSFYTAVSDLSVCERRIGGISRSLAKDGSIMVPASRGAGAVGDNAAAAAASTRTIPGGDMLDKSNSRVQGIDTGLVPSRVLTQTRVDVIFKKETETRSKLSKAWAKWFRSNGVPESKADCPHFRNAMKLTQQLGTRLPVPTGGELGGINLDAEEELS
ncbi:unnamed protein product [Triticum turgidum subsp. durum]|uniref:F-box protein AT5G49610-like beta-propeller domain-containing protein n=1 Tax=Triticum turgidum subsp. durum TaxID=4567 RepID=A0A9R1RK18_TRITD|nr:unnamed protein product [Triticum turgidum subsp. durum]